VDHVSFSIGSRFKVYGFTCADSHLNIRQAAKFPACHGNGQAKQGKQGKGKE
jgi:hypothetical protein